MAATFAVVTPCHALSLADAAHLLNRSGFGATAAEIAELEPLSREQAVDHVLATLDDGAVSPPPPFTRLARPDYWAEGWRKDANIRLRENEIAQMQDWWLGEMIATSSPFRERMALFWHNQFVSRYDPTTITAPFVEQLALFRSAGTRDYRALVLGIMHDPMMLSFLDNVKNSREHPNENLARELLELFTLGAGNYSEHDIKELARVLAGHHVAPQGGWTYRVDETSVDTASKTVLGRQVAGPPEVELAEVADAILSQKAAATFLASRLFREFVSLDPNPAAVERIAGQLRAADYKLRPALRAMLLDETFWAPSNRAALIKSPVELIVGFVRTFDVRLPDLRTLNVYASQLGQELFDPPTVAGWRGGEDWITTGSLSLRRRVIDRLWTAYDVDRREDPAPTTPGLRVRYSAEGTNRAATFRVIVDDRALPDVAARHHIDLTKEASSSDPNNLKPMWETLFVPAAQLPVHPHEVVVQLLNADNDTHLFLNWIEIGGQRLTPLQGQWVSGTGCDGEAPRGMFYCNAKLRFGLAPTSSSPDPSLTDRQAPLNSQIEYGTARLAPVAFVRTRQGSAPLAAPADAAARWGAFMSARLLAAPPLTTSPTPLPREDGLAFARRLTMDPSWNLK